MATDALVTQAVLETLRQGQPDAQTTQAVLEVLYTTTLPDAQVTQAVLEVLLAVSAVASDIALTPTGLTVSLVPQAPTVTVMAAFAARLQLVVSGQSVRNAVGLRPLS